MPPNFKNRTLWTCDNLSRKAPAGRFLKQRRETNDLDNSADTQVAPLGSTSGVDRPTPRRMGAEAATCRARTNL